MDQPNKVARYGGSQSGRGQIGVRFDVSVRADLGCKDDTIVTRSQELPENLHAKLHQLLKELFNQKLIRVFQVEFDQPIPSLTFYTSHGSDRAFLDFATSFCAIARAISGNNQIPESTNNLHDAPHHIMQALEAIL